MNPKTRLNILLTLLAISSLSLLIHTFVYSQARTIEYLPNNESIDTVSKEYDPAITLHALECEAATTFLNHYKYCTDDVTIYQPLCPNCCVVGDKNYRAIKCSTDDNTDDYTCDRATAFSSSSCTKIDKDSSSAGGDKYCYASYDYPYKANAPSWDDTCSSTSSMQTLNHCQSTGCPSSTKPNGTCTSQSSNWICTQNYLLPKDQGCVSQSLTTCVSPCGSNYNDYYTISKLVPTIKIGTITYTWKYVPKNNFLTCMDDCVNAANAKDDCKNKIECCRKNTCAPKGFIDSCSDLAVCAMRFNNQCDKFYSDCTYWTAQKCAWLTEQFLEALYGGGASACFKEIDNTFSYKFVAKSSDTMTIIWQIATTPKPVEGVNLYTKIKVFGLSSTGEIEDPPAHESIVHQKSLNAAFSIYCATAIPKLKQGKAYVIKVYYYIPDIISETIDVDINSMEFILIKIR